MSDKESINQKYANLCVLMGDLTYKKQKMDDSIAEVKAKMDVLNNMMTEIKTAEATKLRVAPTEADNGQTKTENGSQA